MHEIVVPVNEQNGVGLLSVVMTRSSDAQFSPYLSVYSIKMVTPVRKEHKLF